MHDLTGWAGFLGTFGLPFTLYVAAQLIALVRLRGRVRAWSALPIPFMAWVVWITAAAYHQQMNLWPIPLIFLSPLALIYLGLVAHLARAGSLESPETSAPQPGKGAMPRPPLE